MSSIYTRGGYALPSSSLDFKTGSWRTKSRFTCTPPPPVIMPARQEKTRRHTWP